MCWATVSRIGPASEMHRAMSGSTSVRVRAPDLKPCRAPPGEVPGARTPRRPPCPRHGRPRPPRRSLAVEGLFVEGPLTGDHQSGPLQRGREAEDVEHHLDTGTEPGAQDQRTVADATRGSRPRRRGVLRGPGPDRLLQNRGEVPEGLVQDLHVVGARPFWGPYTAGAPFGPVSGLSTSLARTKSTEDRRGSRPDRSAVATSLSAAPPGATGSPPRPRTAPRARTASPPRRPSSRSRPRRTRSCGPRRPARPAAAPRTRTWTTSAARTPRRAAAAIRSPPPSPPPRCRRAARRRR